MKERADDLQKSIDWLQRAFAENPYQASFAPIRAFGQEQLAAFLKRGLPTRKEEAWKYAAPTFLETQTFDWPKPSIATPALKALVATRSQDKFLAVFVNGHFQKELSSLSALPEGVILCSFQEALKKHATLMLPFLLDRDVERHPLATLNSALLSDGLFLYVPSSVVFEMPLHLLFIAQGQQGFMKQPRHLVVMEHDSHLCLSEEYQSMEGADAYFTNAVMDCFLGRHSLLNYYKIQQEAAKAAHFASVFVHQKQHSFFNASSIAFGAGLGRQEFTLHLLEDHASAHLTGFYGLARDGQCLDHHLFIDHAAPATKSELEFHGIIGKKAQAIFNGHVLVRPQAQKTQAKQFNHNILLSPLAEIYSKPDLEIYADDVQCRHGATVGQMDEEALFYLGARGIDRRAATTVLLQAFMEKVLNNVTLPWFKEQILLEGAAVLEKCS